MGKMLAVFLILTSHNLKAVIAELMSTGGRYILSVLSEANLSLSHVYEV